MKHAGANTLAALAILLDRIRGLGVLVERKPGTFYLRSSAFLHFHEDPQGLFADIKLNGKEFSRFPVNSPSDHEALLRSVAVALSRSERARSPKA